MCRIKSYVCNKRNDVNKRSTRQVWNTLQQRRQSSKLRTMSTSINIKELVKFGTSDMRWIEFIAKKLHMQ